MTNSELYDKTFQIPADVLKYINVTLISNPNGEGVKRAKTLLKNGVITYQNLKRLKNFFDYFNKESDDATQYALAGGDKMRAFVETTLKSNRDAVKRSKEVRRDIHTDPNSELSVSKPIGAGDSETLGINKMNESKEDLDKNAVAVIVDKDNKILLLKRSDYPDSWMPNKWSLVGGGIEKGESPEQAVKREIQEETELEISDFVNSFTIQRHENSVETVFACRYDGDPTDVTLDKENSNYGWFSISEIDYLDTVPHLMEYITLVLKKYE